MIQRTLAVLLALAALAALPPALAGEPEKPEKPEKPEALYFFVNYCESCRPGDDFRDEFAGLTGEDLGDYRYRYHNVAQPAGMEALEIAAERYAIPSEERLMPLLILDGEVYAGSTALRTAMPRTFVERASTDSLIYYVYAPGCRECARMDEVLEALPETVRARRGDYAFPSRVVVERISAAEDPGAAAALFGRYGVDEDARFAPCLFLGDRAVARPEYAERFLAGMLERAEAVGTPALGEAE